MAQHFSPKIPTDGLLILLDSADRLSNPSSGGSTLYSVAGVSNANGTVANGTTGVNTVPIDGTNDYIVLNDTLTTQRLSPPHATFNIWFKPSSQVANSRANSLISRGNYNTAGSFFIHMYTNTVSLNGPAVSANFSYSPTNSYTNNGTSSYTLTKGFDKWSCVTVTVDTRIKLFIDGVLQEDTARSRGEIVYGNGAINTGGDTPLVLLSGLSYVPTISNGYWEPFKGEFGCFQMWNRRLNNDEVLSLYNMQKVRFGH